MKRKYLGALAFILMFSLSVGSCFIEKIYADEEGKSDSSTEAPATSISLTPVYNVMQISSDSTYTDTFEVKNDGSNKIEIEVYAAPYSYVYSENEDVYKLGFNKENNFTQITRWISFKDSGGSWSKKAKFEIAPNDTLEVEYKVATPKDIPAGGQYAVLFAHTLTSTTSASGIKTEASPGLIIYGHSNEGEAKIQAEISDMKIEQSVTDGENTRNNFSGFAKIKNTGNIDFFAEGKLKVEPIIGGGGYETPNDNSKAKARVSIIPEAELTVSDEWEDSPSFGIYKATWTVKAGEETQTVEKIIFVNPLLFVFIIIILLTIIAIWIIVINRRRKERRSRLAI